MTDPNLQKVIELREQNRLADALVAAYQALEENSSNTQIRLLLVRTLWDLEIYSVARYECGVLRSQAPDDVSVQRLAERIGAAVVTANEDKDETLAETEFLD